MQRLFYIGVARSSLREAQTHHYDELSDSRAAVLAPVAPEHQCASPKPVTLELRSGTAVRSSDLVRRRLFKFLVKKSCHNYEREKLCISIAASSLPVLDPSIPSGEAVSQDHVRMC